jgi:hypothetical protein
MSCNTIFILFIYTDMDWSEGGYIYHINIRGFQYYSRQ